MSAKLYGTAGFSQAPDRGWVEFPNQEFTDDFTLDDDAATVEVRGQKQRKRIPEIVPKKKRPYKVELLIAFDKQDATAATKGAIAGAICAATWETGIGCVDLVIDILEQFRHGVGTFELPAVDYYRGWRHPYPGKPTDNALRVSGVACSLAEQWSATANPKGFEKISTTCIFTPNPAGARHPDRSGHSALHRTGCGKHLAAARPHLSHAGPCSMLEAASVRRRNQAGV